MVFSIYFSVCLSNSILIIRVSPAWKASKNTELLTWKSNYNGRWWNYELINLAVISETNFWILNFASFFVPRIYINIFVSPLQKIIWARKMKNFKFFAWSKKNPFANWKVIRANRMLLSCKLLLSTWRKWQKLNRNN